MYGLNRYLYVLQALLSQCTAADVLGDAEQHLTVFAPSNEAYTRVGKEFGYTEEGMLNHPALPLSLLNHLVNATVKVQLCLTPPALHAWQLTIVN